MNETSKNENLDSEVSNDFDALCRGFDNGSFYGLEYILDDFFQRASLKPATPSQQSQQSVDWFGLYS